jgi:hypothetical protein
MSKHNGDEATLSDGDFHKVVEALYFKEVDHHDSIQSAHVHRLRKAIEPLLEELLYALHDTRAVKPGQQWTIPMGLSCGMEGDLVIRVKALGPDHDLEG